MEDGLRTVMKEYIDQVDDVCLRLLDGLCLKSKADFLCSRKLRWGIEYETNGTKYLLHGELGHRRDRGTRPLLLPCSSILLLRIYPLLTGLRNIRFM